MTMRLRRACKDDLTHLYEWRNAELTRKFSFNHSPIPWETHVQWFVDSLKRSDRIILIAELEHSTIGVLRYDKLNEDEAKVNIYLVPGHYGQGYGTELLKCGLRWAKENLRVKKIIAEVMTENIASLKAFSKAGFTESYRIYQYIYE